ncbi:hypothetical protein B0H19DRAFT_1083719 [Mycena capillaripes]|nr:hypothetical protein B0H19DRAFT_1083719 [Mycena capillaripes]
MHQLITDSFVRSPSSERRTTTYPGYTARTDEGGETKAGMRISEIADICELHMEECSVLSRHETRRARAQSSKGTPAQRVERVKEIWGDDRSSTGKGGTATHDLRVRPSYVGKCPLCGKHGRDNPKNSASRQSKNQGKKRRAKDRHSPTKQLLTWPWPA